MTLRRAALAAAFLLLTLNAATPERHSLSAGGGCAGLDAPATLGSPPTLHNTRPQRGDGGFTMLVAWDDDVAGETCWVLLSESASPADDHPPREPQRFELPPDSVSFSDPTVYRVEEEILYTLYAATASARTVEFQFIAGVPAVDPFEPITPMPVRTTTPRPGPSQTASPTVTATATGTPLPSATPAVTATPPPAAEAGSENDGPPPAVLVAIGGAIVLAGGAVAVAIRRKRR